MSQASEMIAEVKGLVGDLEKEIKSFEKQIESVGEFTNVLHLNKARIHLGLLKDELVSRRGNVEDAQLAELEAQENAPEPQPESEPAPTPEPVPVSTPEPEFEPEPEPVAPVDPAAEFVAPPETTDETPAA